MERQKQGQERGQDDLRYIDLHMHTKYSDGLYVEPIGNVGLAKLKGLDIIAITDHDHVIGYHEAKDEADRLGITLLPGAEITTLKYHLLALNFDPDNDGLVSFLERSREIQDERCRSRIERLNELGFPITFDEVKEEFPESRIAQYNIFVSLLKNEECRMKIGQDFHGRPYLETFRMILGKDGLIGKFADRGVSEEEAVEVVHKAKGIIGLAHGPKDIKVLSELDRLYGLGIDFLEIQQNGRGMIYDLIDYDDIQKFAEDNGLAVSYGSDHHGPTFERPMLGRGENILHKNMEERLDKGYVKASRLTLKEVWC